MLQRQNFYYGYEIRFINSVMSNNRNNKVFLLVRERDILKTEGETIRRSIGQFDQDMKSTRLTMVNRMKTPTKNIPYEVLSLCVKLPRRESVLKRENFHVTRIDELFPKHRASSCNERWTTRGGFWRRCENLRSKVTDLRTPRFSAAPDALQCKTGPGRIR